MKIEKYLSIIGVKSVADMTDSQIEEFGRYAADSEYNIGMVFLLGTPSDKKNGVEMLRAALTSGKKLEVITLPYETADRDVDVDEPDSDDPGRLFKFGLI